ncbi:MAG: YihY/virulence factor BrkB family protein [Candidatus Eremiobacteraeota bacterium]|nr:YihY/virulence factor BrkB family protein [Candidatus Eremiobacteraeota bacterium]
MGSPARQAIANVVPLAKETFSEFQRHKSQWLAAAIAYFTLFAVAPLIIVVVEIAGFFLGKHQSLLNELYGYMSSTAGPSAAHGIQAIVTATFSQRKAGILSQIIGWAVFVVAAVGLFSSLQEALNTVWDITPPKRTLLETVKERLLSFGTVLVIAFMLLVLLGINSLLTVASSALSHVFVGFPFLLKLLDFVVSLGLVTALFALMFEYLPECRIAWRDVWAGAAVSALLFVIGQFLLGWYLGRAGISSGYGSFGGIVVFLIWVNYSAQIMLFGAEFTHVYARRYGSMRTSSSRGQIQRSTTPAAVNR